MAPVPDEKVEKKKVQGGRVQKKKVQKRKVDTPRTPSPPAPPPSYSPPAQKPGYSLPSSVALSAQHDTQYYLTEGIEGVEHQQYRGVRSFTKAIESQAEAVRSGDASQYAVFSPVTQAQLATIDRIRMTRHKGLRLLYFNNEEILIVKTVAAPVQALVHLQFGTRLILKIGEMGGMRLLDEFCGIGATSFEGNGSQKEADYAWKPELFRPRSTDWPTLVIECGAAQSRDRLKSDAHWWLEKSGGQVKIVLLLSFSETKREIHFEQWEVETTPKPEVTQGEHKPARSTPKAVSEFDIVPGCAGGASLTLGFQQLFLRPPAQGQGKREKDITFTAQELEQYATHVWRHTQHSKP